MSEDTEHPEEVVVYEYFVDDGDETVIYEEEEEQCDYPIEEVIIEETVVPEDAEEHSPPTPQPICESSAKRTRRLEQKRVSNRKYFQSESEERREARLSKKYERDRRIKLDRQLQTFHPDLLSSAGIEVKNLGSGSVEVRVPWQVRSNESSTQRVERYNHQETVIQDMLARETFAQRVYREEKNRSMFPKPPQPPRNRNESMEARIKRLERCKLAVRQRRLNETPEQKERRLEEQRLRTQRSRWRKTMEAASEKKLSFKVSKK